MGFPIRYVRRETDAASDRKCFVSIFALSRTLSNPSNRKFRERSGLGYQSRCRRDRGGELIQIDRSVDRRFDKPGPMRTPIVYRVGMLRYPPFRGRRLGTCFSRPGICRRMNAPNMGTVKAVSPWRWLQTIPLSISC
jgi:hypothetical protein